MRQYSITPVRYIKFETEETDLQSVRIYYQAYNIAKK